MGAGESEEFHDYSIEIQGRYRTIRAVISFLFRLLSRVEIQGLESIPDKGPYLLLTNHLHLLDSPALMMAFPYRAHVFAADKRRNHWFYGPLFRSLDAIWVRRGEVDRAALRRALAVLAGGGILGLAPEGTRSKTGAMQQGHGGAAYMAFRTGARLVPVVITGQEKIFPYLRRLRRATVHVTFGPAFDPPLTADPRKASGAEIRAFTDEIMYRLAALLPPEYRGVYADVAEKRPNLLAQAATGSQGS